MSIIISDSIKLNSRQFLDTRVAKATTLQDLKNWDFTKYPLPNGFEVWVDSAREWYTYQSGTTNTDTGSFGKRNKVVKESYTTTLDDLTNPDFWGLSDATEAQRKEVLYNGKTTTIVDPNYGTSIYVLTNEDEPFELSSWSTISFGNNIPILTTSAYDALPESLKPNDYIDVDDTLEGIEDAEDTDMLHILFNSIRALQAEVSKLKNSFTFGITSYQDDTTVASNYLAEERDMETENLWAVQESELSLLFDLDTALNTDLVPSGETSSISISSGNKYLEIKGKAVWPSDTAKFEEDNFSLSGISDPKEFIYITTSTPGADIVLTSYSGDSVVHVNIADYLSNVYTAPSYSTLMIVGKHVTDPISEKSTHVSFVWMVVQSLANNEILFEGYINPITKKVSEFDRIDLPYDYYISNVIISNSKLSKLSLYSKYQDFSDYVEAVTPKEVDDTKYQAASISIRAVETVEVLDKILDQLAEEELVYVKRNNALYIKSNGTKHKIGGNSGSGETKDNMTVQELLENLVDKGLIVLDGARYDNDGALTSVTDIQLNKVKSISLINDNTKDEYTFTVDSNGELVSNKNTPDAVKFETLLNGDTSGATFSINGALPTLSDLDSLTLKTQRGFIAQMHGANNISKDMKLMSDRVKIGAFYSPLDTDTTFGCSHAYIELENTSDTDYYLDGCYLHYAGPVKATKGDETKYVQATYHLALKGKIPAGGTYLVRGKKYADKSLSTTYISVDTYDMEWYSTESTINYTSESGWSYDTDGSLLDMTYHSGFIYGLALTYGQPTLLYTTPLCGTDNEGGKSTCNIASCLIDSMNYYCLDTSWNVTSNSKWGSISTPISNSIYKNTFELDPAKQAFQSYNSGDSSRLRGLTAADAQLLELNKEYIVLPHSDAVYPVSKYTPKASFEGKNVSTDKTQLDEEKPNMVTCSFGIDVYKTRCFNWISVGDYDEYVWVRRVTPTDEETSSNSTEYKNWHRYQSYWGDSVSTWSECTRKDFSQEIVYNGGTTTVKDVVYANSKLKNVFPGCNTNYTSHKCILDLEIPSNLSEKPVKYEYVVGRSTKIAEAPFDGHCSDVMSFTIYPKSYTPIIYQTTDQQGFHWIEYQAWAGVASMINEKINNDMATSANTFPILINTGDMTQNGTRINEWLDYYEAGKCLFDHLEQMNVVGNNDLGNADETILGTGDDPGKSNPHFYDISYCYEIPIITEDTNTYLPIYCSPTLGPKYVPSLYYFDTEKFRIVMINTEITATASAKVWGATDSVDIYTGWDYEGNDSTALYHAPSTMTIDGNNASHYVYDTLYQYMNKANGKAMIACCHEMPFTVITSDNLAATTVEYSDRSVSVAGSSTGLIGSHCNKCYANKNKLTTDMPIRNKGTYWLSRLLEHFGVKYMIGGHKHTYACTWPIRENYWYMSGDTEVHSTEVGPMPMPASLENDNITFVTDSNGKPVWNGTTYGDNYQNYVNLTKFPIANKNWDVSNYTTGAYTPTVEETMTEVPNYVTYFMLQASGFKLKSNKELPGNGQTFSLIIPKTNQAKSKPAVTQIQPMFARIILNNSKYNTGLPFYLISVKNVVPYSDSEVLNQQTAYKGDCEKPMVYGYLNNKTMPYGNWEENEISLDLKI